MKRVVVVVAVVLMGLASVPASADAGTTLQILPRWGSAPGEGWPFVSNSAGTALVVGTTFPIVPWIACEGDGCEPTRPARIDVWRAGAWVTWSSGSLADLGDPAKSINSKRPATLELRPVMPAHEGLVEIVGPTFRLTYLPRTTVKLSGSAYIRPSKANEFMDLFRPGRGTITVQVTPAAAGRTVVLQEVGVEDQIIVSRLKTDVRGRATFRGDLSSITVLNITVPATGKRAGWQIYLERPA